MRLGGQMARFIAPWWSRQPSQPTCDSHRPSSARQLQRITATLTGRRPRRAAALTVLVFCSGWLAVGTASAAESDPASTPAAFVVTVGVGAATGATNAPAGAQASRPAGPVPLSATTTAGPTTPTTTTPTTAGPTTPTTTTPTTAGPTTPTTTTPTTAGPTTPTTTTPTTAGPTTPTTTTPTTAGPTTPTTAHTPRPRAHHTHDHHTDTRDSGGRTGGASCSATGDRSGQAEEFSVDSRRD